MSELTKIEKKNTRSKIVTLTPKVLHRMSTIDQTPQVASSVAADWGFLVGNHDLQNRHTN